MELETNMNSLTFRTVHSAPSLRRRFLSGAMIFAAAYFTTITVNASPPSASPARPDVIQLNDTGPAVVTGTVVEADENYVIIDSAGSQIRVNLSEVDLKDEADTVFKIGMDVTVEGKMTGDDFGTALMTAKTITARE